jgi:hypothetical protein
MLASLLVGIVASSRAELQLAEKQRTPFVIIVDSAATAPELHAARELASTLKQITGAEFPIQTNSTAHPSHGYREERAIGVNELVRGNVRRVPKRDSSRAEDFLEHLGAGCA